VRASLSHFFLPSNSALPALHSFPTRRSSDLLGSATLEYGAASAEDTTFASGATGTLKLDQSSSFSGAVSGFAAGDSLDLADIGRSEEHTSELQSPYDLVCRLLLEKKKQILNI